MPSQAQFKIVTAAEMRLIELRAFKEFGISSLIIMEHAGTCLADISERNFLSPDQSLPPESSRIIILCGKGNNGGDGFVAARHLFNRGHEVAVFLACFAQDLKGDALANYTIAQKHGISIHQVAQTKLFEFESALGRCSLMIDALFGTGLDRELQEPYLGLIKAVNKAGKPVLAADIPSGLHSDSGEPLPISIQAKATAVFGLPKQGLYVGQGPSYSGHIYLVDIGLPKALLPAE